MHDISLLHHLFNGNNETFQNCRTHVTNKKCTYYVYTVDKIIFQMGLSFVAHVQPHLVFFLTFSSICRAIKVKDSYADEFAPTNTFYITVYFFQSAVCNQHMMHEPNKPFQIMGGICPGGICPGVYVLAGICPRG